MTDQLLPYYNQELEFLKRFGAQFAVEHPKITGRLRLGDDLSEDPHVSRLIESFALLSARTRLKLDDDFPEVTHAMLGVLYPHYLSPIPSTAVVEFFESVDVTSVLFELSGAMALDFLSRTTSTSIERPLSKSASIVSDSPRAAALPYSLF